MHSENNQKNSIFIIKSSTRVQVHPLEHRVTIWFMWNASICLFLPKIIIFMWEKHNDNNQNNKSQEVFEIFLTYDGAIGFHIFIWSSWGKCMYGIFGKLLQQWTC